MMTLRYKRGTPYKRVIENKKQNTHFVIHNESVSVEEIPKGFVIK